MKNLTSKVVLVLFTVLISVASTQAQDVFGKWKTIDDDGVTEKSILEIYEEDGKVYGKVLQVLDKSKGDNPKCIECKGKLKDQPITGMVVLKDLEKDGEYYEGGTILDPNNGKEYSCWIQLEEDNKLKVRGFVGFSVVGRTQYWYRAE